MIFILIEKRTNEFFKIEDVKRIVTHHSVLCNTTFYEFYDSNNILIDGYEKDSFIIYEMYEEEKI